MARKSWVLVSGFLTFVLLVCTVVPVVHADSVLAGSDYLTTVAVLGNMIINHEFPDNGTPAPEGTYTASMVVNFIADFVPIGPGAPTSTPGSLALTTPGPLAWSHEPPPGALLVPGPPGDLDANLHAALPPGFNDLSR